MDHDTEKGGSASPRFGVLLAVCVGTVAFLGVLTYVMATYFPDFPNF